MRNVLLMAVQAAIVIFVVAWAIETDQPNKGAALILGVGVAFALTVVPVALYHMIIGEIRKRRASRESAAMKIGQTSEPEPEPFDALPSRERRLVSERRGLPKRYQ